jgi:hypothetical protein
VVESGSPLHIWEQLPLIFRIIPIGTNQHKSDFNSLINCLIVICFSLPNKETIPAPHLPAPLPKGEEIPKRNLDQLIKKEDPTKLFVNIKQIGEG